MRLLVGPLLVPMLAALLVLTTPMGAGQGAHANELLHPVLPHMHLMNGKIVSDAQVAAARAAATPDSVTSQPPRGPALGAGDGADAFGLGFALGPTLPANGLAISAALPGRLSISESTLPIEFRDPPQDPPPDPFA